MTVSFSSPLTFAAGLNPRAVITGDFNNDDRPDVVILNRDDESISLLLGNGRAGFAVEQRFSSVEDPSLSAATYDMATGDFDGDGFLDLAIATVRDNSFGPSGVTILLNNGDGGFATPQFYQTGRLTEAVAIADVNGDTFLDVVSTSLSNATVAVLLGDGTGGFAAAQTFATLTYPEAIALADFNGDSRPEIVVLSGSNNSGTVMLNTAGSFASQPSFAVASANGNMALGDFNEDALPDLATFDFDGTISILLNNNSIGFSAAQTLSANANTTDSIIAADFDRDGDLDLIIPAQEGYSSTPHIAVFLGDGSGHFTAQAATFSLPFGVRDMAVGDFNGDDRPDLISVGFAEFGSSSDRLTLHLNSLGLTIQTVTPALQDGRANAPVDRLTLTFNERVRGFDRGDLVFTRDGAALGLTSATLTTADGGRSWVLGYLANLTRPDGSYSLSLRTSGTGLRDLADTVLPVTANTLLWRRASMGNLPSPIDFTGGEPGRNQVGSGNNNRITGSNGNDTLFGDGGNDRIQGLNGQDLLGGKGGHDVVFGNDGNDRILGGAGDDVLNGGTGHDFLSGNNGNDQIAGGAGNDRLNGGVGRDTLTGGSSIDVFRYTTLAERGDLILDFRPQDVMDLGQLFRQAPFRNGTPIVRFETYIRLAQVGTSTEVRIDADGGGARRSFVTLATLLNIRPTQLGSENFFIA